MGVRASERAEGPGSRVVVGARRAVVRLTAAGLLAGAAVVAPVATLPAPAAHVVKPEVSTHHVRGIDTKARGDASALDPAVGDDGKPVVPRRAVASPFAATRSTTPTPDAASAHPSLDGGRLAVLGTKESTGHFLVAGVTWASGTSDVVLVSVRIREGGTWSPWTELEINDVGVSGERPGTDPLTTSGADGIQVRVVTKDGSAPKDVQVDVVDPGSSAADATAGSTARPLASADAATGYENKPTIVTRAGWGADESLSSSWPDVSAHLDAMYVHHTAGTNSYTKAQSPAIVRGIYAYHTKSRGWPDIGYQFLVDKYGTIFQGRKDAIYDNPIGAQAGGYNTDTIGVSAMGNFETAKPSSAMLTSIEKVLAWKGYEYGVSAVGHARLLTGSSTGSNTRAKAGTWVTVPTILGHRDTNGTACPGKYLYAKLPAIRSAVHTRIAAVRAKYGAVRYTTASPTIVKSPSTVAPVQWFEKATYTWKPVKGAKWYQVLTRSASLSESTPDSRSWRVQATVTRPSYTFSTAHGWWRVVAIRPIAADHKRGPVKLHTRSTRPVGTSTIDWSPSFVKVNGSQYLWGKVWASGSRTASFRVHGVKSARSVVVKAVVGPQYGRLRVVIGGVTCGYINLHSTTYKPAATIKISMKKAHSGTAVFTSVDSKRKAVSTVAFPRTP